VDINTHWQQLQESSTKVYLTKSILVLLVQDLHHCVRVELTSPTLFLLLVLHWYLLSYCSIIFDSTFRKFHLGGCISIQFLFLHWIRNSRLCGHSNPGLDSLQLKVLVGHFWSVLVEGSGWTSEFLASPASDFRNFGLSGFLLLNLCVLHLRNRHPSRLFVFCIFEIDTPRVYLPSSRIFQRGISTS